MWTPIKMLSSLKQAIFQFSDSIPRCMNIKEINRQNQGGRIHAKAFLEVKSAQLNQYVKPTLEEYSCDVTIIHVGINGILWSKHCEELDKLPRNIIKVGHTCQKYNIEKIYISNSSINNNKINIFDINKRFAIAKCNFEFTSISR